MKHCKHCGIDFPDSVKFCDRCGESVSEKQIQKANLEKVTDIAKKATQIINRSAASSSVGESMLTQKAPTSLFSGFKSLSKGLEILSPLKVIVNGFKGLKSNITTALKDKKKMTFIILLTVSWFVLTLLPVLGFNPLPVKVLSFLTFAQGGMSNAPKRILGGVLGKTVFASFLFSLLGSGNPITKIKSTFLGFKDKFKLKGKRRIPSFILGISLSAIAFNFMVMVSSPWSFMAGFAATYLSINSLKGGFLKDLLTSIWAKVSKNHSQDLATNVQIGFSVGFALSSFLGLLSNIFKVSFIALGGYIPQILGILLLIVSSIWLGVSFLISYIKGGRNRG